MMADCVTSLLFCHNKGARAGASRTRSRERPTPIDRVVVQSTLQAQLVSTAAGLNRELQRA